jgi:hypothetical protein
VKVVPFFRNYFLDCEHLDSFFLTLVSQIESMSRSRRNSNSNVLSTSHSEIIDRSNAATDIAPLPTTPLPRPTSMSRLPAKVPQFPATESSKVHEESFSGELDVIPEEEFSRDEECGERHSLDASNPSTPVRSVVTLAEQVSPTHSITTASFFSPKYNSSTTTLLTKNLPSLALPNSTTTTPVPTPTVATATARRRRSVVSRNSLDSFHSIQDEEDDKLSTANSEIVVRNTHCPLTKLLSRYKRL